MQFIVLSLGNETIQWGKGEERGMEERSKKWKELAYNAHISGGEDVKCEADRQ